MRIQNWFRISAAARDKRIGEVYIYDAIGGGWEGGVGAKDFADQLNALGELDSVELFINSPGGSVFDGVTIYNLLKRNRAPVNVHVDGVAASIASIVAMAGDTIEIARNGLLMLHDPWTLAVGNARDFRKEAEILDQVGETLVGTYADRTGQKSEKVRELMAAETWLEADEAVKLGFADRVSNPVKMAAHFDLSRFRNAPRALAVTPVEPPPTPVPHKLRIADDENWLHQNRVKHGHPLVK